MPRACTGLAQLIRTQQMLVLKPCTGMHMCTPDRRCHPHVIFSWKDAWHVAVITSLE